MIKIRETKSGIAVTDFGEISLDITLDCGQCFRWNQNDIGDWSGTAYERHVRVKKTADGLLFLNSSVEDVKKIWIPYFDLDRDYFKYLQILRADKNVCEAIEKYGTIRILSQEPWETLCSFIISACNNIPRIKMIIEKYCRLLGRELDGGVFAFPRAADTALLSPAGLAPIGAGFRAPYIISAARAVEADGGLFDRLKSEGETEARRELMTFRGVGKKVAECTMLFSLGFDTVFPTDTHIIQAAAELYPDGYPECFSAFPGLAQQYVFYAHMNKGGK